MTTLRSFVKETQLTASAATLLESGPNEKMFIGMFRLTNTSSSNVSVTIWKIATSTTATSGSGGNWTFTKTLPPGKSYVVKDLIGDVLGNSEMYQGLAGTASVVNVDISGTSDP